MEIIKDIDIVFVLRREVCRHRGHRVQASRARQWSCHREERKQKNMRKQSLRVDNSNLMLAISTLGALRRHLPKLVNVVKGAVLT